MPSHLGSLELPHTSPHFLEIRRAVRGHTDMRVVVGLSGGPDSVALLAGTLAEGREVEAICIDHGLQDASAEVAATAAETARALGAAATVLRIDVPSSGSMEANARHARYTALASAANGRPIWVGHTMDDQAETLLLSALRGHATGMLERSTWEDGTTIVRPLLGVRRANTVGACSELGLEVWSDPHNDDQSFRRVALRNRLLPDLANIIGGDPVPGLAQAAERAGLGSGPGSGGRREARLGAGDYRDGSGAGTPAPRAASGRAGGVYSNQWWSGIRRDHRGSRTIDSGVAWSGTRGHWEGPGWAKVGCGAEKWHSCSVCTLTL